VSRTRWMIECYDEDGERDQVRYADDLDGVRNEMADFLSCNHPKAWCAVSWRELCAPWSHAPDETCELCEKPEPLSRGRKLRLPTDAEIAAAVRRCFEPRDEMQQFGTPGEDH
jgi:hypothetical protein